MGGVFLNKDFSYAILPLKLIYDEKYKSLSSGEKLLYVLLLNRTNYSRKNSKKFYDEKNGLFVYFSTKQIQEQLNCSKKSAIKMLKNLEKAELIKREYQRNGLHLKFYVTELREVKMVQKPQKDGASFDIELAEKMAHKNRRDFGTKKNNRRRIT